jgi:hypothetical protein
MNEQDLRDCFAMFALLGIVSKSPIGEAATAETTDEYGKAARGAYLYADAMLEARNKDNDEEELGIAAVKPKRKYPRSAPR